jgi:hypothetical protein
MDEMTQQNAALVEEAAAAAESLQDQASKLAEAVSVFRLEAGSYQAAAPARRAPKQLPSQPAPRTKPSAPRPMAAPKRLAVAGGGNAEWEEF